MPKLVVNLALIRINQMIDWIRGLDDIGFRFAAAVRLKTVTDDNGQRAVRCGYREMCWAYYSLSQVWLNRAGDKLLPIR